MPSPTQSAKRIALVKRQSDLSELMPAPRYPFAIDEVAAARGAAHYQVHCASCHDTGVAHIAHLTRENFPSRLPVYDAAQMGYGDDGFDEFDTAGPGNSNNTHNYGTNLSTDQERGLIEYLKTL